MNDVKRPPPGSEQANEGEGNKTAARNFNHKEQEFVNDGKVPPKAREAQIAVDGPEGKELAEAEAEGRARGKGMDKGDQDKPGKGSAR